MTKPKKLPPLKDLIQMYDFHFDTGIITKRDCGFRPHLFVSHESMVKHNNKLGFRAFSNIGSDGYYRGMVNNIYYKAHRLLYYVGNGAQPEVVDHINRNKQDNRLCNLRESNDYLNGYNRDKLGEGIRLRSCGSWIVKISWNGKEYYIGSFPDRRYAIIAKNQFIKDNNININEIKYL